MGRKKIMYGIGFMILVVKSPAVVKELMYSTGSGRTAAGMASGAASTIAKQVIMRRVK